MRDWLTKTWSDRRVKDDIGKVQFVSQSTFFLCPSVSYAVLIAIYREFAWQMKTPIMSVFCVFIAVHYKLTTEKWSTSCLSLYKHPHHRHLLDRMDICVLWSTQPEMLSICGQTISTVWEGSLQWKFNLEVFRWEQRPGKWAQRLAASSLHTWCPLSTIYGAPHYEMHCLWKVGCSITSEHPLSEGH